MDKHQNQDEVIDFASAAKSIEKESRIMASAEKLAREAAAIRKACKIGGYSGDPVATLLSEGFIILCAFVQGIDD